MAPTVTLVIAGNGEAAEGGQHGKVFFQRTGSTSGALTVRYKVGGSAKADIDYQALPGTVVIPAGSSRVKVKIKAIDDSTPEGARVAKVKLLPATDGSYLLGSVTKAKVKIIDND